MAQVMDFLYKLLAIAQSFLEKLGLGNFLEYCTF